MTLVDRIHELAKTCAQADKRNAEALSKVNVDSLEKPYTSYKPSVSDIDLAKIQDGGVVYTDDPIGDTEAVLAPIEHSISGSRNAVPSSYAVKQAMPYRNIGSQKISSSGSTTSRSLISRFSDVINVKDFGAIGDSSTDDTAAIQAAIDYASLLDNKPTIFIPAGTYNISTYLHIATSGIRIVGAGVGRSTDSLTPTKSTLLNYTGANRTNDLRGVFVINYELDNTEKAKTPLCTIKDLSIECNSKSHGISALGAYMSEFRDLFISNPLRGIVFNNWCYSSLIERCEIYDYTSVGIDLYQNCHGAVIDSCRFIMAKDGTKQPNSALRIASVGNCSNVSVVNCTFDTYRNVNVIRVPSYCRGLYIAGNYLEAHQATDGITNEGDEIIRLAGIQGVYIAGNRITAHNTLGVKYGIRCGSATIDGTTYYTQGVISGNMFAGISDALVFNVDATNNRKLVVIGNVDQSGATYELQPQYAGTKISDSNILTGALLLSGRNGTIGSTSGAGLYYSGTAVSPTDPTNTATSSDNAYNLGQSNRRWKEIFAANSAINTSDERVKTNIVTPSSELLKAWGKISYMVFQFIQSVEDKGEDARLHVGVIAQKIKDTLAAEGIDADKYGLFCYDQWDDEYVDEIVVDAPAEFDDEGNIVSHEKTHIEHRQIQKAGNMYGIRYPELLCLEAAYQRDRADKSEAHIAALELRIAALETKLMVKE